MAAFTNPQSHTSIPAASSTTTAVNITPAPLLNQLLIASCLVTASTAGLAFTSPTDNGSNTGWTQIQTAQKPGNTGNNVGAVWYKVVTAADVASLTTVTFNYSGATVSGGLCCVDEFAGFSSPTLDLDATPTTGAAATTTGVISQAAVANQSNELAVSIVVGGSALGAATGTNQYSPNNGSTEFALSGVSASNNGVVSRQYATSTTAGVSPATWQVTWTNSRAFAAWSVTFSGALSSGGMFLVLGR